MRDTGEHTMGRAAQEGTLAAPHVREDVVTRPLLGGVARQPGIAVACGERAG
jgi:hypothetical protein